MPEFKGLQDMLGNALFELALKQSPQFKMYVIMLGLLGILSRLFFVVGAVGVLGLIFGTSFLWTVLAFAFVPSAVCKGLQWLMGQFMQSKLKAALNGGQND